MGGETTQDATTESNKHNDSFNALDLSWLSESVMEAALQTKHLSLQDTNDFHDSLRAAEEVGSMNHAVSERLHQRINEKQTALVEKLVAHETARVFKKLGLYDVLKSHRTWDQVQLMADSKYMSPMMWKGVVSIALYYTTVLLLVFTY